MTTPVTFQPYDAAYLCCVGESVSFDNAWRAYAFIDRICSLDQCDDPAFADHRASMSAAVQRGIAAGLVELSGDSITLSMEIRSHYDALRDSGLNECAAAEEIDAFLQSRTWNVVSDGKLST